jgi:hypothetical protein
MEQTTHPFHELFEQLGLPSDEASIRQFIATHRPLPKGTTLTEAPFWSKAQAQLLRESLAADADWAEVVDQLNLALRG